MELKQRKVCGNCKVFSNSGKRCSIGYNTKNGKEMLGVIVSFIPLEPCPKPMTVSDSLEALNNWQRK